MSVDGLSEIEIGGIRLPRTDWEVTPASMQGLVETLLPTLAQQQEQLGHFTEEVEAMGDGMSDLEERVRQSSQNSSLPHLAKALARGSVSSRRGGKTTRRSIGS
ncbi:MAG: hypothetical protein LVT47_09400 [Cyanobacteria bacterium LVE1205-1]|jgi:hypothetical protein